MLSQAQKGRALGLSPPTRGNPYSWTWRARALRSIPAHAGEPSRATSIRGARRVYPRPRGGTLSFSKTPAGSGGLSPPTRGNRVGTRLSRAAPRSIPAHAGEPSVSRSETLPRAVYPRPRGGTSSRAAPRAPRTGLSPPTRGNPPLRRKSISGGRSIPAHAGEPPLRPLRKRRTGVYPRPRGGTPR